MIICENLSQTYKNDDRSISALKDVSFRVHDKEFVCIVGPSGCGKTTLLKLIAGLIKPSSGSIEFNMTNNNGSIRDAMVFQEHGLFPWLTVLDNVAFGLEMQGVSKAERNERALSFISKVGLNSFTNAYPHELSIGMRQRVGIARAFVADPQILLMDEPFGSLDSQTKLILEEELLRIWKEHQKMVLYVTHDIEEAILLADRVLVMTGRPGQIREEIVIPLGRPRDLTHRDRKEFSDIQRHIWQILEDEVRRSLWQ